VIAANDAGAAVEPREGSIEARGNETFDGVVANIQSSFFVRDAPSLAAALAPRGSLVASGFLREDVDDVSGALTAAGFAIEDTTFDGPWAAVTARR
jgi:ribosomal protein L11 methyltransferase